MNPKSTPSGFAGAAFRLFAVFFCLGLGAATVSAQSNLGILNGHVISAASKSALPGVRVSVAGTPLEAFTNSQGDYRLPDIPAGQVTVTFTYVGYPPLTRTATVAAGQTQQLDGTFNDEVVTMDEFKISGDIIGTAKAINTQRAETGLTNIVASDLVGQLPDKNLAESLSRVPGVELDRDKGEGRYIIIRGLDPVYNSVSINGVRVSTAEKGTREAALDVISSTFISTLEVSKVTTPDMDGDAMGGSVNIKTRSGFDQEGTQEMLQIGTNYAHQEDRHGGYNVANNYAGQFDGGKLGIAIDLAADARPFTAYTEPATGWQQVTVNGGADWVPTSMDFRHYDAERWREGVSTSIDYKISGTQSFYFRYLDSDYTEKNQQWLTTFPFASGTFAAATNTSGTDTIPAKDIIKSEAQIVNNKRMTSMVSGLNSDFGPFTNNLELGWTTGKYTRPTLTIAYANTTATQVTYNFNTSYNPTVAQTAGPSLDSPASYAFSTKSGYSDTTFNMHEVSVQDNLRYDLPDAPNPTYLKVGVEYRSKNANLSNSKYNITAVPYSSLASIIYPGNDIQDTMGYSPTFNIRGDAVQGYYSNQSAYPETPVPTTIYGGSFTSLENIAAPYLMGGITLGHLKLTAGGRVEATNFTINGWSDDATSGIISPVTYYKNYANFLPALIAEYELTPNDIIRASWTNTISRPDYVDTAPGRTVNDAPLYTVTTGNPELDPLQSMNYDLSFEHYYSPVGLVSAALFYKSIKNFSYQALDSADPAYPGYVVSTYFNGPSAWIEGVELNWIQQLSFLPGLFRGLGLEANAVVGTSEAKYPTRPGEVLPFTGYGHDSGNLALTYNYAGITARIADQFHGRRLESNSVIGANATQDEYEEPFHQIDASMSYTYRTHWEIYFEGSNLFNAPLLEYYGGTGDLHRIQTKEAYGWSAESGIRWRY
jgi:TonB-dependent receptor